MGDSVSYNPNVGGGGPPADGSITIAKLGGDITTAGKALLDDADAAAQRTTLGLGTAATSASSAFAATSHAHSISDVSGLQTALDGKQVAGSYAASTHTHAISDTTGLQAALDGKAASSHTHTIANVTGLQTALDGKQAAGSYAAATHTHIIADTTGLQTALDGKAASSHTHAAADIASGTIATARLGSGTANNTTFLRGDNTWAVPSGGGGGSVSIAKAFLTGTQANSTVTPVVMTGATFTLTPGQNGTFTAILVCTAAATTTGVAGGFRVAQAAGADGTAKGAWMSYVNLASTATATGLADGDVYNVSAGTNNYGEILGTATTAGNNVLMVQAIVHNTSTNVNTTVTFEFRSEVASSAVTAQIGSGVTAIIG